MNQGHDDVASAGTNGENGGNNSAEQFQPKPAARQGIFSSPDLAVNSENLNEIKPELSEDNKSRIASAFRSTDASAKRRAVETEVTAERAAQNEARWEQNISGENIAPAARATVVTETNGANLSATTSIPSTATGDIRMPGTKKKSKLPLVLLAFVVLVTVGGSVAWMLLRNDNAPSAPASPLSAAETAFAKYANYLLYGEEKDALEGEYDYTRNYAVNQQLISPDYNQDYWDKATALLRASFATLRQSESEDKNLLVNTMENYLATLDFLQTYKRIGSPNDETLLSTYISSGAEGAEAMLEDFYAPFYSLDSETASTYANQRKQQYRDIVDIYGTYQEMGCFVDGVLREDVCSSVASSSDIQNRLTELSRAAARDAALADNTIENSSNYLVSYCWDLYGWLGNPSELKENVNE